MVKCLTATIKHLFPPKTLIPITKPPIFLLSNFLSNVSTSSLPFSPHHPLVEMSQRSSFAFHHLNLFKNTPIDPSLIHSLFFKTNLLSNISTRTSLITAYAKAGDLGSSLALFDEALARDLISWNAVITACVHNSHFETSVVLFQEMVREFREFDSTTLVIVVSGFSRCQNLKYGTILHGTILKRRFDLDTYLCNALIDMYAKCGNLSSSEFVFEGMEVRDVASWNSIINGCLCNDYPWKSAYYFREMSRTNVCPDQVSLSSVISACSCLENPFAFGESAHALVIKLGYEATALSSVGNSLISFYSQCEDVEAAEKVFKDLACKNVVSWNSMISGLIENDRVNEGLDLFHAMQLTLEAQPDSVTLLSVIQVCGELNLVFHGKSIHGFSIRREIDSSEQTVANALLDMYLKCDDIISAELLFKTMSSRDLISWNSIISGYAHNDFYKENARSMFRKLLQEDLRCSLATLLAILPSCNDPQDLKFGKSLHCWELKYGFGSILLAVNALMLMYINCADIIASSLLLRTILSVSDIVSWNTIIGGFAQYGHYMDALKSFEFVRRSSLHPDPITLINTLSACGNLQMLLYGQSLHGLVLKSPIGSDVRVRNALITMYFRCADTKSSELVFESDGIRNLCSWSCMLSGFAQNKEARRGLEYFLYMTSSGFRPNDVSIVGVLCACTQLGNLRLGTEVNGYVFRYNLQDSIFISSALVDMYSKCGRLDIAIRVFQSSQKKTIASWNSMISAYGFHGQGRKAIELFSKMSELGVRATQSTFIALLSACSHSGLIDEGKTYYNLMVEELGMELTVEHHVLIVDMLGRAGRLREAYEFVKELRSKAEPGIWGALLSACSVYGDIELGKSIAEYLFCLEPENTGYYVTLANLYAYCGMWSCVEDVRSMIRDRRLMKPRGSSFIDVLVR